LRPPETIAVPSASRIPDPRTGLATPDEYDRYFGLARGDASLVDWTHSCLKVLAEQRNALAATSLTADDKQRILEGMCVVFQFLLESWLESASAVVGSELS
jgi:hypothetical protein